MFVKIMKIEELHDLLPTVEGCCKSCDRGKFIRTLEGPFTFFEVFSTCSIDVHQVPVDLAASVVGVSMKSGYYTTYTKGFSLCFEEWAGGQRFHKCTRNIIGECEIGAVKIEDLVQAGERVFHPEQYKVLL
jgi:hypothetical protein